MTVRLPRLNATVAIVDPKTGLPTTAFMRFWETFATQQEETDAAQQAQIDANSRQLRAVSHADGLFVTASADGGTAKATVTDHTRVYLDKSVEVDGATITGLAYATTYSIFYDDEARNGGAVTYQTTTTPSEAVTSAANPFRHLVGVVTTPAGAGSPPVDGGGTIPPGYPGGIYQYETP